MGELLAPVGSLEMLSAAIEGGADAVFMAGPRFGARAKEASFDMEALAQAIEQAHRYGVRVYITLNTLIKDGEMAACKDYIDALVALGIDALIVQDLGVVRYVRETHPGLALHASTQMAITDASGIEAALRLGLRRVVIARETSLKAVEQLSQLGMPLEVFVHGALCYAYSGQCLLSSVQGGRSGNRGQCAQPCRLAYRLDDQTNESYAMSMKDLATIDSIRELAALGVASFKIEGRLRSPDYVFHTVRAYRAALDGIHGEDLEPYKASMYQAFNREYTGGHLLEDTNRLNLEMSTNKGELVATTLKSTQYKLNLRLSAPLYKGDGLKVVFEGQSRGIEVFNIYGNGEGLGSASPGTVVAIDFNGLVPEGSSVYRTRSRLLTDARLAAQGSRRVALVGSFSAVLGEPMRLTISDGVSRAEVASDEHIGKAEKAAAEASAIRQNLEKLGDTVYAWKQLDIALDEGLFIPKSAINALRRRAVDALEALRLKAAHEHAMTASEQSVTASEQSVTVSAGSLWEPKTTKESMNRARWHVTVENEEQAHGALAAIRTAGLTAEEIQVLAAVPVYNALCRHQGFSEADCAYFSPRLNAFEVQMATSRLLGIAHMGHALEHHGSQLALGIHSTVMNRDAYSQWQALGVSDVLASVELSTKELAPLAELGLRVVVYGQLPVMYTRTCPKRAKGISCKHCTGSFSLVGKETKRLKVHCSNQLLTYYTEEPLYRQGPFPYQLAMFVDETKDQVVERLTALLSGEPMTIEALDAYQRPIF